MSRSHQLLYALNAGGVDSDALSRIDLEKMRLAGQAPVRNWLPTVLGPMTLRPGLKSLYTLSAVTRPVAFVRDSLTTAIIGFSDQTITIFDADGVPIQVNNVSSFVTNQSFVFGGGGWSDVSDTGAGTDGTATLGVSGTVSMLATRWRAAATQQAVSVSAPDQSVAHTLRIEVSRGPVFFRVGSSSGAQDVVGEVRLETGVHKLTFTPGVATIYLRLRSEDRVVRAVSLCQFENVLLGGTGNLTLPTPWTEARLPYLSWDQSADVMFIGDGLYQQRKLQRFGAKSWSLVKYQTKNGPFKFPDSDKISLTPSAYTGNGSLTSNIAYFDTSHVGTLFELTHPEQHVIDELHAVDQITDYISIRGLFSSTKVYDDRNFGYNLDFATGAFVGTIVLESSADPNAEIWTVTDEFSAGAAATYNDEQSNLLMHYRLRVKAYTSGYAIVSLVQLAGSTTGKVRITEYNSSTSVNYETVDRLGGVTATRDWRGPVWSDSLGWPRVPCFRDDRLHWFSGDKDYASIVDDYENFDDTTVGDSGPIVRSVGSGSSEGVRWAVDMDRFVIGTTGYTAAIQASDFNEVVTPTSYTIRRGPTIGASYVPPAQADDILIMTDRSNKKLYDLSVPESASKLKSMELTRLNPRAVRAGVVAMDIQRRPDTRIYCVLEDGTCAVLTYDKDDKVVAFTVFDTDGDFEDVCVLPADDQDDVYFIVSRNGARYLERLGKEANQESVSTCAVLDGFKELTGSVSSITGASHLNGKTVAVWADGARRSNVTISGGSAALGATYARVIYGIAYDAEFLSVKLAYAAQLGTAIGQTKIVRQAGLILSNSCVDGIRIGKDASYTDPPPEFVDGALRTASQFFAHYDEDMFPIQSEWNTDSRIYLKTNSAYGPVTVQAIVLDVETREGVPTKGN